MDPTRQRKMGRSSGGPWADQTRGIPATMPPRRRTTAGNWGPLGFRRHWTPSQQYHAGTSHRTTTMAATGGKRLGCMELVAMDLYRYYQR